MTADDPDRGGRWRIVFGSTIALIFSTGPLIQFTFGVFVKPVSESLRIDRGRVSLALFVALALSGLMTPIAGRLVDRIGVRRFGIPVIILFSLAFALIGAASSSIGLFICCYGLAGIFSAGQTPLIYAKAIASAFDEQRGLALGIAMAGVGIGTAVLPRLAQQLVATVGWHYAYMILGALTLVVSTSTVALLVREQPLAGAAATQASSALGHTTSEALLSSVFWKLMAAFTMVVVACSGVMAHIVPMMTDRGVSPRTAAMALTAGGGALVVGRLVAGYLLDVVFAPYVALFFFSMPLIAIAILLTSPSAHEAVIATALVGSSLGAEIDLIAYLQSRYLGLRRFGEIYSYFLALFLVGSGLGPYLMGLCFARSGAYSIALIGFASGLAAACVVMLTFGAYPYVGKKSTAPGARTQ
jgi:predicted MFS family arabinose efflux permease